MCFDFSWNKMVTASDAFYPTLSCCPTRIDLYWIENVQRCWPTDCCTFVSKTGFHCLQLAELLQLLVLMGSRFILVFVLLSSAQTLIYDLMFWSDTSTATICCGQLKPVWQVFCSSTPPAAFSPSINRSWNSTCNIWTASDNHRHLIAFPT